MRQNVELDGRACSTLTMHLVVYLFWEHTSSGDIVKWEMGELCWEYTNVHKDSAS